MTREHRNEWVIHSEALSLLVSEKQEDDCSVCTLLDKEWRKGSNSRRDWSLAELGLCKLLRTRKGFWTWFRAEVKLFDVVYIKKNHSCDFTSMKNGYRDTWVAQWVKRQTLDFSSGHDLMVMRLNPPLGSTPGVEPTWDSLSHSPSSSARLPLMHILMLSLSLSLSVSQKMDKEVRGK